MLHIEGLIKHYPGFCLEASLNVAPGSVTGLIGQNGAGKSTLFKAVLGLIRPDGGSLSLFGRDARSLTEEDRRRMGTVLADAGFSGYLSVRDVRTILRQFYPGFQEQSFKARCEASGITDEKKVKDLSTGMKAKLKVLSALSHGADFLLLDEPTAGLDVIAREEILDLLRDYMAEDDRRAILVSSHISSDLETLCDDFYMIHQGKMILHEETDRLLSDYAVLKVSGEEYASLDRSLLLKRKKESYGYMCLTDQRSYFLQNCPGLVVEKSGLDDLITLMAKGEAV